MHHTLTIDPPLPASPPQNDGYHSQESEDRYETSSKRGDAIEALKRRVAKQRETIKGRDELLLDQARQIQEMRELIEDLRAKVIFRTNSCEGCCEGEKGGCMTSGIHNIIYRARK